jgi:hypothetical protein
MKIHFAVFLLLAFPAAAKTQCNDSCGCGPNCHCDTPQSHCGCACCGLHPLAPIKKDFGVEVGRISKSEHLSYNGTPINQRPLPSVSDDSGKLHLTIIGTEAERHAVLRDLDAAPELAEFRDRFLIQDYPPDHWAVALCGFYTAGHPTIYLQMPTGKVLHRQDDYNGPKPLADALRRASADYQAGKDPDLRTPSFDLRNIPTAGWILLAGFGLAFLFKKGPP